MRSILERALRATFRTEDEWRARIAERPPWWRSLLRDVLLLALLPAVSWTAGRLADGTLATAVAALVAVAGVLAGALVSSLLLAAGLHAAARLHGTAAAWDDAMSVAATGSAPVLLCGTLLFERFMIVACMGALLHCFAVCASGVVRMLRCREADAASVVGVGCAATLIASIMLGYLCGATGIL